QRLSHRCARVRRDGRLPWQRGPEPSPHAKTPGDAGRRWRGLHVPSVDRRIQHPQRLGDAGGAGALDVLAVVGTPEGVRAFSGLAGTFGLAVLVRGDKRTGLAQAVAVVGRGVAGFGADGRGAGFEGFPDRLRLRLRERQRCESRGEEEDGKTFHGTPPWGGRLGPAGPVQTTIRPPHRTGAVCSGAGLGTRQAPLAGGPVPTVITGPL